MTAGETAVISQKKIILRTYCITGGKTMHFTDADVNHFYLSRWEEGRSKPVETCLCCNDDIYEGEDVYHISGDHGYIHKDCLMDYFGIRLEIMEAPDENL